ncbi:hypothetical protein [Anaerosolibacter sp.]|uniref:hypothetical protein n=1 Tax=Anaerosolibacter sp. TaxID=1872527 RepID=UPI0039F0BEB6
MFKKLRFYLRCMKAVWNDQGTRPCRQKCRRLAREFERISKEMGLSVPCGGC